MLTVFRFLELLERAVVGLARTQRKGPQGLLRSRYGSMTGIIVASFALTCVGLSIGRLAQRLMVRALAAATALSWRRPLAPISRALPLACGLLVVPITVELDARLPLAFRQEVSVAPGAAYAGVTPPSSLDNIPADLSVSNVEYSGIYQDGWTSGDASITLSQPAAAGSLSVRGTIPDIGDAAFRSEVTISVDGTMVARRLLGPGRFAIQAPVSSNSPRRQVQLHFSNVQQLPGADQRPVAALLESIGFGQSTEPLAQQSTIADIVDNESSTVFGANWYDAESQGGESFRWVNNDAEIDLPDSVPAGGYLSLVVEAGPGGGGQPLRLAVVDSDGSALSTTSVFGRESLSVFVPPSTSSLRVLRLHVDGGGMATANDARTLNFRVFSLRWSPSLAASQQPATADIVADNSGLTLGANWYDTESQGGEAFRWVSNDAEIDVPDSLRAGGYLTVVVEAGPGGGGQPLRLDVADTDGSTLSTTSILGKDAVKIYVPPTTASPRVLRLHVDGGGLPTPNDTRTLNFRVFSLRWQGV